MAELRLDAEDGEAGWVNGKEADAFGLRSAGEIYVAAADGGDVLEDAGALIVPEFGDGHAHVGRANAGKIVLDIYELFGMRVGERVEESCVDHAEDGGGGADAEGDGENGDGAKAGRFAQHAQTVTKILGNVVEPIPAPGEASALF
jgi:hypothetical protein